MSAQWNVGDFNSDMHRLTALLDVICEVQFERPQDRNDARVDDLLWIARSMVEGLRDHDDARHSSISTVKTRAPIRMTGGQRNG